MMPETSEATTKLDPIAKYDAGCGDLLSRWRHFWA
jgi:hypothetical protein